MTSTMHEHMAKFSIDDILRAVIEDLALLQSLQYARVDTRIELARMLLNPAVHDTLAAGKGEMPAIAGICFKLLEHENNDRPAPASGEWGTFHDA